MGQFKTYFLQAFRIKMSIYSRENKDCLAKHRSLEGAASGRGLGRGGSGNSAAPPLPSPAPAPPPAGGETRGDQLGAIL